jgi:AraC family transcriptional regulator
VNASNDYTTHYATHPVYSTFPQERRRPPTRPGAVPLEMLRVEQGAVDAANPAVDALVLALAVDLAPRFEGWFDFGDGRVEIPARLGALTLHPPDTDVHCFLGAPNTVLIAPLPITPLATALEREPEALTRAVAPLHHAMQFEPLIEQLMCALWREGMRDDPAGQVYVDGLILSLGGALLSRAGEAARAVPPPLDDRRLARAAEHVEAHLAEPLSLTEMAAVACLSPWHFNRAFRAATGLPPHRYVTARRVERAKRLLATDMALIEVAMACGFSSQSHFGEVFKAQTGATPGHWRRARA